MTSIESVTLEVTDPAAAADFYGGASGLDTQVRLRASDAKDAGVPPEGSGSHRLVIGSDAGPFTDPDGFAREAPSP
jgi:hypothetical protein